MFMGDDSAIRPDHKSSVSISKLSSNFYQMPDCISNTRQLQMVTTPTGFMVQLPVYFVLLGLRAFCSAGFFLPHIR
jgi:hypothetical protein